MTIKDVIALILVFAGITANLMFQESLAVEKEDAWQLEQLHDPSPGLQDRETAGRITIYDGIKVTEVDRAMDEQFDRIDSMMFVRTKWPVEDGSFVEDSDCD